MPQVMSCSVAVALCCALGNYNLFLGMLWHIVCGPHVFSCWSEERWMSACWEYLLCEMLRALSAGVCIYHGMAVSIQGSNSAGVPQMGPLSIFILVLRTFPANPGETKHNLNLQVGTQAAQARKRQCSLSGGRCREMLETNPALLLGWKPLRTLHCYFKRDQMGRKS